MTSKADLPPIVVSAIGLGVTLVLFNTLGLESLTPAYVSLFFELFVYLYASYWAFDIRKGLRTSLFHKQAFSIGLLAVGLGSGNFASNALTEIGAGMGVLGDIGFYLGVFFTPLVIFYWLDSTILASRRADPLGRDTLRWSRVRIVFWGLVIASPLINFTILTYGFIAGFSQAVLNGTVPISNPFLLALVTSTIFTPIVATTAVGLIFLPVIAKRSKDRAFRAHILWVIMFVAVLFVSNFIISIITSSLPSNTAGCPFGFVNQNGVCIVATNLPYSAEITQLVALIVAYIASVAGGFFLYKSSKSLVPMNRRSPVEMKNVGT